MNKKKVKKGGASFNNKRPSFNNESPSFNNEPPKKFVKLSYRDELELIDDCGDWKIAEEIEESERIVQDMMEMIKKKDTDGGMEAGFIEESKNKEFVKQDVALALAAKKAEDKIKKFMKSLVQKRRKRGMNATKKMIRSESVAHEFFKVAKKLIKPSTETVTDLIKTSFDDLYNSLDPTKPVVFIITTHGSRPRTNNILLNKLKSYMKTIVDKFKSTTNRLLKSNFFYSPPNHEEQIQVSYIKAYLDGIYQILDDKDVELLQELLIEKMNNYHTEASEADGGSDINREIPKEYIDDIAKKLKDIQFIAPPRDEKWWMEERVKLMRELRFDDDNFYLALMALHKVSGVNRWNTIQKEYKPGDPIDDRVDKILSQQSDRDTKVKGTDWSVKLVGKDGKLVGIPYLFSPYSDLIDIGSFTINGNRLLSIESLHLLGSKIIEKRKQEYPNGLVVDSGIGDGYPRVFRRAELGDNSIPINTTMMIVDFSCGSWRKPVAHSYARAPRLFMGESPFPPSSNPFMGEDHPPKSGCIIAGGGTKSKKKKSHKSKKFKNNKKRSNKKINRRKYTRKK